MVKRCSITRNISVGERIYDGTVSSAIPSGYEVIFYDIMVENPEYCIFPRGVKITPMSDGSVQWRAGFTYRGQENPTDDGWSELWGNPTDFNFYLILVMQRKKYLTTVKG